MKIKFSGHKKNRPRPREHRHIAILRVVYLLIIAGCGSMLLATVFFVYQNIFVTLDQLQSIVVLQNELRLDQVDMDLLKKVQTAWQEKFSTPEPVVARDPFAEPTPSAPTSTLRKNL